MKGMLFFASQRDRKPSWFGEATRPRMNRFLAARTRWSLSLAAVPVLALGTGLSSAVAQAPASRRPLVAVLPLENNSGDVTQDFFADGMTDEIAFALTGVRGLDVVARSSSFRFSQPNRDIKAGGHASERKLRRAGFGAPGDRPSAPECLTGTGPRRRAAMVAGI